METKSKSYCSKTEMKLMILEEQTKAADVRLLNNDTMAKQMSEQQLYSNSTIKHVNDQMSCD